MANDDKDLTDLQKAYIEENYQKKPDLIALTRAVFNDDSLDGRTREGRMVRAYMIEKSLDYTTTKHKKVDKIKLSDEQLQFIETYASEGMSAFEIAKMLFPHDPISPLSKQTIVIADYIKSEVPGGVVQAESALGVKYEPPKNLEQVVFVVNRYVGSSLKLKELTLKNKKNIESLLNFFNSPRLAFVVNNYNDSLDRELFEAEFVRAVWDKPDLTNDEINLYINVCVDYINLKNISSHIEKLNRMFNDAEEQQDMTVRLAELLKTKSEEYNQCEKRMESLIQRLNGDRAKRIASKKEENTSILTIVNLFQEEKEREIMLKMANMQKEVIRDEAENIESMPSWKARVLGVSKGDVI
tara:strand:+ start:12374 stop:13438 length:1065 start_codon:yes stop_codon:yes gene_type:complete